MTGPAALQKCCGESALPVAAVVWQTIQSTNADILSMCLLVWRKGLQTLHLLHHGSPQALTAIVGMICLRSGFQRTM